MSAVEWTSPHPTLAEALTAAGIDQDARDAAWDAHTARTIATMHALLGAHSSRPTRPPSAAKVAAEDALESAAEDRAFFARYGGTDRDADFAALVAENRGERQAASALDWLERGGVR